MKANILILIAFIFTACHNTNEWNKVEYNNKLSDPFFDTISWEYLWYILKDEEGNFSSAIDSIITERDTVHLVHTANCITNHQGEHELQFCHAYKNNDTLVLYFPSPLPAYWLDFEFKIVGNKFKASVFGEPFQAIQLQWQINRRQLTLNKNNFAVGDSLKGKVYLEFTEKAINDTAKYNFYFTGVFNTLIEAHPNY